MIAIRSFHSCFAPEMNDYLVICKNTLGESAFSTRFFDLSEFDTYLTDNGISRDGLTEEVISRWVASYKNKLHISTIQSKVTSIRRFIRR